MKNIIKEDKTKILVIAIMSLFIMLATTAIYFSNNFKKYENNISYNDEDPIIYRSGNSIIDEKTGLPTEAYISDIDCLESRVGWGSLGKDEDSNGNLITLKVENNLFSFNKGIFAHATSYLIYDLSEYNNYYKYFVSYIGLNRTAASSSNGVKYKFSISNDRKNWTQIGDEILKKPGENADFVKIALNNAKYFKIDIDSNGPNGNDHSVLADAKFVNENYQENNVVKTLEELDTEIKNIKNQTLENRTYELLILQREFISKAGRFAIKAFVDESEENKEAFNWLFNNVDNLRLYINGGNPDGTYYNSLKVLSNLLKNYKADFDNTNVTKYGTVLGNLYKKMAITLSLTHSQRVALWMQPSHPKNQSDAVTRYKIFKELHANGKFTVSDNIDITKWYENYTIEEMRFVLNNIIDDEEIVWLNEYTQSFIDANPNRAWSYLTPHPYMAYVWPNYSRAEFHDLNRKNYWDQKFNGIFSKYKVSYSTETDKVYKVWMNFRNEFGTGAVCGGISKTGSNIRTSHGIPAAVIGQPGHAAIMYYTQDAQGNGYWNIDNDVSGWTLSEKGERLLLGWGNKRYGIPNEYNYKLSYLALSQEVINDYPSFEKSNETVLLANSYGDNLNKQEEIYRKALNIQPLNIDAWHGLIQNYKENKNKTSEDYKNLAEELMNSLKYFPLPMYQLSELIKMNVNGSFKAQINNFQNQILTEASKTPNNSADNYFVYQPSLTRTMANFLLNKVDTSMAKFSFDGEDAGKIILASSFDGSGVRWDYSLDGPDTSNWKEVSFTADEEHKWLLNQEEINSISAEKDIYIHIVGTSYESKNLYKIDITEQNLPTILYANDLENRVIGVTTNMEWRFSEKDSWTSYQNASPDLKGDKIIEVRAAATGTKLTSNSTKFTFTKDNEDPKRKYVSISHLSIESVSSEATGQGRYAKNAIDGNYNTNWHSAWNGSDTERFITIKIDHPITLSEIEYIPGGGGNGKIIDGSIYGSLDGNNWTKIASAKDLKYTGNYNDYNNSMINKKTFTITNPKEIQYVKIVADKASNGNWFTANMFNLYEDATKVTNKNPTATIIYNTTSTTSGEVIARLVNPSTNIKIINNEGLDTHVFTENGKFTFEFIDDKGNKGIATANVTWIDKKAPTANIEYKLDNNEKLVTLIGNISENVYLLDKNNKKINYIEVKNNKINSVEYLNTNGIVYKTIEVDEEGNTKSIEYKNTTGKVTNVDTYKTILENGKIKEELFLDKSGNNVTVNDTDKQTLQSLQQIISNPLEYTFENSDDYEFKFQDLAGNISTKKVRVDYISNSNKILASDITYDITTITNKDVTASINLYMVDPQDSKAKAIMIDGQKNTYTFKENGTYTFKYKDQSDKDNWEVRSNKASVTWIDKTAPTANVAYSTKDGKVIATLMGESEKIIVTNNGGNRTYTFEKNGTFTFTFVDAAGNQGRSVANVTSINDNSNTNGEENKTETNVPNKNIDESKDPYISSSIPQENTYKTPPIVGPKKTIKPSIKNPTSNNSNSSTTDNNISDSNKNNGSIDNSKKNNKKDKKENNTMNSTIEDPEKKESKFLFYTMEFILIGILISGIIILKSRRNS